MRIKHCYSNDYDTFVATSAEEAFQLYLSFCGEDADSESIAEWCECNGNVQEKIILEDREIDLTIPPEAAIARKEQWTTVYSATYDQWAAVNEIGFLASTEY